MNTYLFTLFSISFERREFFGGKLFQWSQTVHKAGGKKLIENKIVEKHLPKNSIYKGDCIYFVLPEGRRADCFL